MNVVTWVLSNWDNIIIGAVLIAAVVMAVVKFLKLTPSQQMSRIQLVLLELVTEAERILGTQTGKIKRSAVYAAVVKKFPIISIFVSEAKYDELLNEALAQLRALLEQNDALYEYVYGKTRSGEPIPQATVSITTGSLGELLEKEFNALKDKM